MGESFKLHAQALTGYEDAVLQETRNSPTPTMAPHTVEVAAY